MAALDTMQSMEPWAKRCAKSVSQNDYSQLAKDTNWLWR